MTATSISILVVDDNEDLGADLVSLLERKLVDLQPIIQRVTRFDEGEALLKNQGFDLAILDVRLDGAVSEDDEAGRRVFERVSMAQWLPVIFWTAVPAVVEDLTAPPLVQVANKTDIHLIEQLVRDALASGVPQFARQVASEVESAVRGFLRDLVASQWGGMDDVQKDDVLPLLANRLSFYLRNGFLDQLHLAGAVTGAYTHPSAARCYLLPPVTDALTTGDVFRRGNEWWVLVTPQCDMEIRPKTGDMKAEYLRLLRAVALKETTSGKEFIAAASSNKQSSAKDKVVKMLGDDHRFYYLPAYLNIPHLLVDFEQAISVPRHDLLPPIAHGTEEIPVPTKPDADATWTRIATVDAPYSQALLYRLSRAVARIGIEDIPPDAALAVLTGLREEALAMPGEPESTGRD